jgi:glycosyltransferase involved in cell wall biosynthesis
MPATLARFRNLTRTLLFELDITRSWLLAHTQSADLSLFHEFVPPPTGGGHQFLRALWRAAETMGLKVENESISHTTRACLMNSFNFDGARLRRLRRNSVLYVHRIDGPIDVYRGRNDGVDQQIWSANQEFADKTIFQSYYSMQKHLELGLEFKEPVVVLNAADPLIFHMHGRIDFARDRKIRLIAASWSDNPNKGASIYQWLDQHLDFERFEFVFVGRSPVQYKNISILPPVDSHKMAELFRGNDIYITASRHDPCSNSLIEALTCGLPALYLKSGGHPEIVQEAGFGFDTAEEIPLLLDRLVDDYELRQAKINIPSLSDVCTEYLKFLELV